MEFTMPVWLLQLWRRGRSGLIVDFSVRVTGVCNADGFNLLRNSLK